MKIRKIKPLIRILRGIRDKKSTIEVGKHKDFKRWIQAAKFLEQAEKDGYFISTDNGLELTEKGRSLINKQINEKINYHE